MCVCVLRVDRCVEWRLRLCTTSSHPFERPLLFVLHLLWLLRNGFSLSLSRMQLSVLIPDPPLLAVARSSASVFFRVCFALCVSVCGRAASLRLFLYSSLLSGRCYGGGGRGELPLSSCGLPLCPPLSAQAVHTDIFIYTHALPLAVTPRLPCDLPLLPMSDIYIESVESSLSFSLSLSHHQRQQ